MANTFERSSLRVTFCGIGAVGSNLADNLARQGVVNLRAIDHDRVEQHNIATQLYGESDVGVWKVESLRNHLFRVCGIELEVIRKELTSANARTLLKNVDLIIDAFDNSGSRRCVQEFARSADVACLHVGLHQDYCEVIWDEDYRVPRDVMGDVCANPFARNLVTLATAIASEAILRWLADGTRSSFTATLRDFAVHRYGVIRV